MTESIRSPGCRPRRPPPIVLLGIDGAGKTTAATALADSLRAAGRGAVVVRNRSGRRWLLRASDRIGRQISARWANRIETVLRTVNVLTAHTLAACTHRVVIMDRHLACQLVLRTTRDLPSGRLLPWLSRLLLRRATVVVLDVLPEMARTRILARGKDDESMYYLRTARAAYLQAAVAHGWLIIDATGTTEAILSQIPSAPVDCSDADPGGSCSAGHRALTMPALSGAQPAPSGRSGPAPAPGGRRPRPHRPGS